jgi:glycerol-3-phosphate dehydrogenase
MAVGLTESGLRRSRDLDLLGQPFDLVVVGGGINGCGIAWEAALHGLRVLLVERDDIGSGTSSWSSRLIHGGLKYLEKLDVRLVRELCENGSGCSHRHPTWSDL